ncbi:MAG: hypothetical protein B7Z62_00285 [Deltaproteobacteria bacterium 37-65-8]|nr:MAG: hypothetical protein B7Z62_00285 [Deltaproteobacteria bacterium 37-65-8]
MLEKIPLTDLVYLAIGIAGIIMGWIGNSNRLPAPARHWLAKIGEPALASLVAEANAIEDMYPRVRRAYVLNELRDLAKRKLGLDIPTSVANLLLEYVYQKFKLRSE